MESPQEPCQNRARVQRKCKDVSSRYMQRSTVSSNSNIYHQHQHQHQHQQLTSSVSDNGQEQPALPPPLHRPRPKTPNSRRSTDFGADNHTDPCMSPRSAAPTQSCTPTTRSVIAGRRPSRIGRNQQVVSSNIRDDVSVGNAALRTWSALNQGTSSGGGPKPWASPKKMKRAVGCEEDGHIARMLENQYMQWRFVNAKVALAAEAKQRVALMSVYSASAKLLELRNYVAANKSELARLMKMSMVCSMVETQMPYFEVWSRELEEDHSSSLSGTIQAMRDASLRLPLVGNAKADVGEVSRVLGYAEQVMESVSAHTGVFGRQADAVNNFISDVADVVRKEIALMEVCRDMLTDVQKLQVMECSLRSTVMQFGQILSFI